MSQNLDQTARLTSQNHLRQAGSDLSYLIDHSYDPERAATFVCDHHGLGGEARELLLAAICGEQTRISRAQHALDAGQLQTHTATVDASSTLAPIACILAGKPVVLAQDDTLQLASPSDKNVDPSLILRAVDVILDILSGLGVTNVELYLDKSTPDAERLSTTINDYASAMVPITNPGLSVGCLVVAQPQQTLAGATALITQNPALIDRATSWLSLSQEILSHLPEAQVIDPVFE